MAVSDQSTGRTHEPELAHHIDSGEAAAFVTMLLGGLWHGATPSCDCTRRSSPGVTSFAAAWVWN